MKYNIRVSLSLMLSEKKLSDRIDEIKSAAPYLKYHFEKEIPLFSIILMNKEELKRFLAIIDDCLRSAVNLQFVIEGWSKKKINNNSAIFFKTKPTGESKKIISEIFNQIEKSGLSANMVLGFHEPNYDILIAESSNSGEIEHLWCKLEENSGILSKILLQTIYKKCLKPSHIPRKFCYLFDILEIIVYSDDKKYRTYSIPCGEWVQSNDKSDLKKTLEKYRILKNYQLTQKTNNLSKDDSRKVFVASDLHLSHSDIIEVTARPFGKNDIKVMDEVLISNWNFTVREKDTVIFAGDLTYDAESFEAQNFLKRLNGNIIFVNGNHDAVDCKTYAQYELKYNDYSFLIVHNPKYAPEFYDGWIIHGHTHNSRMCEYPFINFQNKTINISCELTQYQPLEIDAIISIIENFQVIKNNKIYSIDAMMRLS